MNGIGIIPTKDIYYTVFPHKLVSAKNQYSK
jgi:hypothetical protein